MLSHFYQAIASYVACVAKPMAVEYPVAIGGRISDPSIG
jgi:hypothetical protein